MTQQYVICFYGHETIHTFILNYVYRSLSQRHRLSHKRRAYVIVITTLTFRRQFFNHVSATRVCEPFIKWA